MPAFQKPCYYCQTKTLYIDYKDAQTLRRFMTPQGRISSKRRSGLCSKHQRAVATAIKRARYLALLPYVI